ncbi:MAG TPA: phosphotransferase [Isosphaeraceae bacterium]|nr:phosphotransferase [Isosphaeraceae bacterium]
MRRSDEPLLRRLRRLDFCREATAVEPITSGITNHNFVVRTGSDAYVARIGPARPLLGIDRRNEVVCHQAAGVWGLAPEVVHHEDGLLIIRFVDGRALEPADVRAPQQLERLAGLLRHLHGAWDTLVGEVLYFCPFQTIRTYAHSVAALAAERPADLPVMLEDVRRLSRRIEPFRPVLCHNDLMPANLIDDGQRLWLVDWEYAGVGHPLFDLANASANAALDEDQDRAFLAAYRHPAEVVPRELAEMTIFKTASLLREALWATIQAVVSEIDFDYRRYADANFEAYRQARSRLKSTP